MLHLLGVCICTFVLVTQVNFCASKQASKFFFLSASCLAPSLDASRYTGAHHAHAPSTRRAPSLARSAEGVSICTFVPVKQVNRIHRRQYLYFCTRKASERNTQVSVFVDSRAHAPPVNEAHAHHTSAYVSIRQHTSAYEAHAHPNTTLCAAGAPQVSVSVLLY